MFATADERGSGHVGVCGASFCQLARGQTWFCEVQVWGIRCPQGRNAQINHLANSPCRKRPCSEPVRPATASCSRATYTRIYTKKQERRRKAPLLLALTGGWYRV